MRILMITPELPYPLDQGGRIRMFHFLEYLASRHDLHLVSVVSTKIPKDYLTQLHLLCASINLVLHPVTRIRTIARIGKSLVEKKPYILNKYYSTELKSAVSLNVEEFRPECILMESQYIIDCVADLNVPIIVDLHDSAYTLYSRFADAPGWHPKKLHGYLQRVPMKKFEGALPNKVAHCVTASDNDRKLIESLSGAKNLSTIPNGVDLDFFERKEDIHTIEYELLFVGSMDYHPNVDAAAYLVKEIMPEVWLSYPNVRLAIVGRNPLPEVRQFERDDRVFVSGFVEDVRP